MRKGLPRAPARVHHADMSEFTLVPMTAAYAADILTWRYPPPYDWYDVADSDVRIRLVHAAGQVHDQLRLEFGEGGVEGRSWVIAHIHRRKHRQAEKPDPQLVDAP